MHYEPLLAKCLLELLVNDSKPAAYQHIGNWLRDALSAQHVYLLAAGKDLKPTWLYAWPDKLNYAGQSLQPDGNDWLPQQLGGIVLTTPITHFNTPLGIVIIGWPEPFTITDELRQVLQQLSVALGATLNEQSVQTELYQRNEVFEASLATLNQLVWEYNLDKQTFRCMGFAPRMTGNQSDCNGAEMQKNYSERLHPDDRERVLNGFYAFLQKGNKAVSEDVFRMRNALEPGYIWVQTRRTLLCDETGSPAIVIGTTIDITDQKKVAFELEKHKEQYQFLVQNVSQIIFTLNQQKEITFLNDAWKEILGYETADCIGKPVTRFIDAVFASLWEQRVDELLTEQKAIMRLSIRFNRHEGNSVWLEVIAKSIRDAYGNVSGVFGTIENIEEKHAEEQLLQESNEKLNTILNSSKEIILSIDLETGQIENVNNAIGLLGYTPDEWVGQYYTEWSLEKRRRFYELLKHASESNTEIKSRKISFANKDNSEVIPFEFSTSLFYFKSKRFLLCVLRDIRDRIAYEKGREQSVKDLQLALQKERELNDLRTRFISTASHQFRTPLTVIQSGVDIMGLYLEGLPDKTQQKFQKQFNRIYTEVVRLQELMNDVLLLGRADASRTPFNPRRQDLLAFCNELIEQHYASRQTGQKVILTTLGNPVPVSFDSKLLDHALENILSNAFKYSYDQDVEMVLNFGHDRVTIAITDYGIGIPPNEMANLFQPFYRAANTTEIEGTGLGLSIAKEYIDKHGGQIFLNSKLNKGTTVSVILSLSSQPTKPD
jgi:PAS domain S-box-containing protein